MALLDIRASEVTPRRGVKSALALILVGLNLSSLSAFAADAAEDGMWFVNLAKTNYGKTYCPPKGTMIKDLAAVLVEYSRIHPELNDRITDEQALKALSGRYPCTVVATPELGKTELSTLGAKQITVTPTGEFAMIDTKATIEAMQKLRATKGHESDDFVATIVRNAGNYAPPALFSLADLFYRQGDVENAVFWLNAGRLRAAIDGGICKDITARSAVPALVSQMPRELIKHQFDDLTKVRTIVMRVIDWDQATPYNYDRRWINLHGMRAINSGMGNQDSSDALSEPSEKWPSIASQTRDQYRKSLDDAIAMVQKQREASSAPDGPKVPAAPAMH